MKVNKIKAKELLSIPNILTYIRLILIPFFVWAYAAASATREPRDYLLAAVLLFASGATDVADGFIARHFNMITDWGKMIDPVADKFTQAAIAFCLVFRLPWMWFLVGIFVIKELTFGIASFCLLRRTGKKLNGALWFGKVSTAVFYVVTIILIAYPPMPEWIAYGMMIVSGFFLILAFALYMMKLRGLYLEYKTEQARTGNEKPQADET